MEILTEKPRALAFILSEANGYLSREVLTIASGAGKLQAGTVLGKISLGAATSAAKSGGNAANTGALTLDAVTPVLANAKVGVYTVRCITAASNGGIFRVEDPDGFVLGDVAVAATFADGVKFSIADGSQDFIVGEGFDITVAAGSGEYVASPNAFTAAKPGAENACAILAYPVDATDADVEAVCITNDAEVKTMMLIYDSSVDNSTKRQAKLDQLRLVKIKAR